MQTPDPLLAQIQFKGKVPIWDKLQWDTSDYNFSNLMLFWASKCFSIAFNCIDFGQRPPPNPNIMLRFKTARSPVLRCPAIRCLDSSLFYTGNFIPRLWNWSLLHCYFSTVLVKSFAHLMLWIFCEPPERGGLTLTMVEYEMIYP